MSELHHRRHSTVAVHWYYKQYHSLASGSFAAGLLLSLLLQAVNRHLDILRPAIANYGGSVDVLAVDGEDCLVRYDGPESIGSGIKAAIKEKFPDITNVVFTL